MVTDGTLPGDDGAADLQPPPIPGDGDEPSGRRESLREPPHESDPTERPATAPPAAEEIALEAARCRRLQRSVDVCLALIYQSRELSLGDAIEIALEARRIALALFPGREETFDLLYRPRLMRAIGERFGIEESR